MTIENTRNRDNLEHLMGVLGQGQNGYIESMEAAGQKQLVASSLLPSAGPWDELEALGFVKGETVRGDDMFVKATLPVGWTKEGSDHPMWSYILDERGIRRCSVFYKAAFYDRSARISVTNVGWEAATHVIYGDEPVALPEHWDAFTSEERRDFMDDLTLKIAEDRESIAKYPDLNKDGRYTNYITRAEAALALASN